MRTRGAVPGVDGGTPRLGDFAPARATAELSVDLSVVIPCLDAAAFLAVQLEALVQQRLGDWTGTWEVIVADNGSTDGTRAIAESFLNRIPNLRIVDASARRGRHFACNVGVAAAHGRAIVFVDGDDEVTPGYVAEMGRALAEHDVVAARLEHVALDPEWMRGVASAFQTKGLPNGFGFLPFGAGCSLGLRRSVFDAVGGFREHAAFCEDVDLSWRAQLAGYHIEFVSDAVVHYRARSTLLAMFRQHRNFGRARVLLYRDYRAAGMPARSPRLALAEWWFIVRVVPRIRTRAQAAPWSRRLGRCVGRLQGSVQYRVWYP